ncbi:MAG: hypothetical protein JWM59_2196 [Verrucomicrobiales bacterium]|nr:hypothetical protein [Verrucomicrobiales bacterium]
MKPDPYPDSDPHVHSIKELAELMLRRLLAVNTAARASRPTGRLTLRRSALAAAAKRLFSRPRHKRPKRKGEAAWR